MSSTDFNQLAETIRATMEPELITLAAKPDGADGQFMLVPKGMEAQSVKKFMDEYRPLPERRKGTITADRISSFCDITNRFKAQNSALFASGAVKENAIAAKMTAILDYHPATPDNTDARNAGHRVEYKFPVSKEFAHWIGQNKTPMEQIEFALFLEDRIIEMATPGDEDRAPIEGLKPTFADPLEILELARNLELYSNEQFQSKNKLSSGETEFKFTAVHVDSKGAPVKIPDFFVISVPIFEAGAPQRIPVRLRYRLGGGKVMWFYDLYRVDQVFDAAFDAACVTAKTDTGLPLFIGTPESAA